MAFNLCRQVLPVIDPVLTVLIQEVLALPYEQRLRVYAAGHLKSYQSLMTNN